MTNKIGESAAYVVSGKTSMSVESSSASQAKPQNWMLKIKAGASQGHASLALTKRAPTAVREMPATDPLACQNFLCIPPKFGWGINLQNCLASEPPEAEIRAPRQIFIFEGKKAADPCLTRARSPRGVGVEGGLATKTAHSLTPPAPAKQRWFTTSATTRLSRD